MDSLALKKVLNYSPEIFKLHQECQKTLQEGGRVFISGCGATGRLALSIEKIANDLGLNNRVIGFMAGGDYALVKSVESFEDREDFGVRQLQALGFNKNDLLLGVTEGGETSFVLGTINFAKENSNRKPYFIYCNPNEELASIERSRLLIEDPKVEKLNLVVGEMALSGSTRMQATTVQMLCCGVALFFNFECETSLDSFLKNYIEDLLKLEINTLAPFVEAESKHYLSGGVVTYLANEELAIAVMTDTTERSPTFNLKGFEKIDDTEMSLSFLSVAGTMNSSEAWQKLLGREPRALDWTDLKLLINLEEVYAFDISTSSIERRTNLGNNLIFEIRSLSNNLIFNFENLEVNVTLNREDLLFKHLTLKMALNAHSTLVMGRIGRFEGNMMTYVKASNLKLVDRSIRYAKELLKRHGVEPKDEDMARFVFEHLHEEGPIVIKLRDYFLKRV